MRMQVAQTEKIKSLMVQLDFGRMSAATEPDAKPITKTRGRLSMPCEGDLLARTRITWYSRGARPEPAIQLACVVKSRPPSLLREAVALERRRTFNLGRTRLGRSDLM